jgi:membrane protease YdiL (CAAX protease family)
MAAAGVLVATVACAAVLIGVAVALARRSGTPGPVDLGLRATRPAPALAWTAIGAAVVAAFAFCLGQVADLGAALAAPPELRPRDFLGAGPDPDRVPAGAGALTSALARVVLTAAVAEVLLRGFALPVLLHRFGVVPALAVTAVLTLAPLGYAAGGEGSPTVLALALVVGAVLGVLALVTRSVYPGIGLLAAVLGVLFAAACGWSLLGAAALATSGAAASVGLAAGAASLAGRR